MPDDDGAKPGYDVGYGKPPIETRFQKGHKVHPRRGASTRKNLKTAVLAALEEKRSVLVNGKRRNLTNQELLVERLMGLAIKGSPKAMDQLLRLISEIEKSLPAELPKRKLPASEAEIRRRMTDLIHQAIYNGVQHALAEEASTDEQKEKWRRHRESDERMKNEDPNPYRMK